MRKKTLCCLAMLVVGQLLVGCGAGAAERGAGARVDVDRGGIHVVVGNKGQANVPAVKVRDMIGLRVYNASDENLGKIEDLVMDPSAGKIRYAVLSFGGFLGMGDKLFAVPWEELKLVPKGTTSAGTAKEDHYALDISKDALKSAPGFDKQSWPDFADRNWSTNIDKFYSAHRSTAARGTPRR
jgi:sporulation protein YlmC with PRC-barrel domain